MGIQTIDLGNTDAILFNGEVVEALYLNGQIIWGSENAYIIHCEKIARTGDSSKYEITATAGESDGLVSVVNDDAFEDIVVSAGTSKTIDFASTVNNPIIKFTGGFTSIAPVRYAQTQAESEAGIVINSVESWLRSQTKLWSNQFASARLSSDLNIPYKIMELDFLNAFPQAQFNKDSTLVALDFNNNADTISVFPSIYGYPQNSIHSGNCYVVNNVVLGVDNGNASVKNDIIIPDGTIRIPKSFIGKYGDTDAYLKSITIPSSVVKIETDAFSSINHMPLTFNHSKDAIIDLPAAGSDTGIAYYKSAYSRIITTDNLVVKNYNWAADNCTATFMHLDGTPWKLSTPVVTLTDSTISWDSVSNAAKYIITYTPSQEGIQNNIEVVTTSYDLSTLGLPAGTYSVQVQSIKSDTDDEHDNSNKSTAVSYIIANTEA